MCTLVFCKEQNALAFNWDTLCQLALCLHMILIHLSQEATCQSLQVVKVILKQGISLISDRVSHKNSYIKMYSCKLQLHNCLCNSLFNNSYDLFEPSQDRFTYLGYKLLHFVYLSILQWTKCTSFQLGHIVPASVVFADDTSLFKLRSRLTS